MSQQTLSHLRVSIAGVGATRNGGHSTVAVEVQVLAGGVTSIANCVHTPLPVRHDRYIQGILPGRCACICVICERRARSLTRWPWQARKCYCSTLRRTDSSDASISQYLCRQAPCCILKYCRHYCTRRVLLNFGVVPVDLYSEVLSTLLYRPCFAYLRRSASRSG